MPNPEVVAYLQANLNKFPVDDLRRQLALEGVTDQEFDEAIAVALRGPQAKPARARKSGPLFLAVGAALVLGGGFLALNLQTPGETPFPPESAKESAFIGRSGYVIRLPKNYAAIAAFKNKEKTHEVVYFCKAETDPTNFLNEGLYGQLGIIRLESQPSPVASTLEGLDSLSQLVTAKARQRGDKFRVKNLQVSSLNGIEIIIETPFPRLEAYILGQKNLYTFTAGHEDEVYREIVTSLRETQSEN